MVKAYLRYELSNTFGVINSNANLVYDHTGKLLVSAALENINVWKARQGTLMRTLVAPMGEDGAPAAEVTQLAAAPGARQLAAGHADGAVRIWNLDSGECEVTLAGHRGAVTALRYNRAGAMLASGAQDTDVIVWDVVAEAGLFRLRAHTGQVTDLAWVERENVLLTGSKDGHVRAWDLATQHCFQTLAGAHGEVWALDVDPAETRLVVGAADAELHCFHLRPAAPVDAGDASTSGRGGVGVRGDLIEGVGGLRRTATERVAALRFDASGRLLAVQSAGRLLEVFRVRPEAEVRKHMARRRKRKREKGAAPAPNPAPGLAAEVPAAAAAPDAGDAPSASDELAPLQVVRAKAKLRALAFSPLAAAAGRPAQVSLALANNMLETWGVSEAGAERVRGMEAAGHRAGVRAVALAPDDCTLLSLAGNTAKVWNAESGACLRTVEHAGHGLCAMFAPGGRHAVVGTKEGAIDILDVGAATVVETLQAHTSAVWSVVALPDSSGFVSCSADHDVKFWEWQVAVAAEGGAGRQLGARHTRTLKMADDVLCCRVSADGRLLAVALLDSTIQVFFLDTLKFCLSLYGHKLPVLSMDISSDSTLLVSGSADKNIKIWGLDFGDCHKSLFAHQDSVMQVAFVPGTHYVFTAGKDRALKYWDADRWELLLTLAGHHAEVWCVAVSAAGDFAVSGGADRSLRVWRRTEEPFFVEEERERRLESLFEADGEFAAGRRGAAGQPAQDGAPEGEAGAAAAGRRTREALSAADRIADALDLAAHEAARMQEHAGRQGSGAGAPPAPNPLLMGQPPEAAVLKALAGVRANELEQALLLLPYTDALRLLTYLCHWLRAGLQVELCCRVAALLVRLHHAQLTATPAARGPLVALQRLLRARTGGLKDVLGFNLAGVQHLQRLLKDRQHSV
ncbi:hypothetical protein WJX81_007060 [Elliptochloris bilobata]|uniref:Small-subunit processome Utp12 domain-containing protein n=1 Tax=Elliptochloris bilobata TaxID=381761 RepID=A0AAW1SJI5_9CHLO